MTTPVSPQDPRVLLRHLYEVAVARAQPATVLAPHLPEPPMPGRGRTVVIGAGKASGAMARSLEAAWPAGHALGGVVLTRYGHVPPCPADHAPPDRPRPDHASRPAGPHDITPPRIQVLEAGHPVPDEASLRGTQALMACLDGLTADDLVIALISGGGSALLTAPPPGCTLADEQALHQQLLRCGAAIGEMNTVRRHLSAVKGGRLALRCGPARLVTLAISDVPGDRLEDIASGPTVPDPTSCADALAVIERYKLQVPEPLMAALRDGTLETVKPGDARLQGHEARLIATPHDMLQAAAQAARDAGLATYILSDRIEGEAREAGKLHAALARHSRQHSQPFARPCVLLSGGETTVTLDAQAWRQGSGGRCAEFLLAAALALDGEAGIWMLAADTDGIDGQSDAAGAMVSLDTLQRAREQGLDARAMLNRHDAGRFFSALGDQVHTGPTHTNVNDFRAVLIT